jgi:hypothetical protein
LFADIFSVESAQLRENVLKLNPINWLVKDSSVGMKNDTRKEGIIKNLQEFLKQSLGMVHIRIALPNGVKCEDFKAGRIELYDHTIKYNDSILKFREATVDIDASLLSNCGLFNDECAIDLQKRFQSGCFSVFFFLQ